MRIKEGSMTGPTVTLESVARRIAADAGIAWPELADFPGFSKGRWRDDARWLIRRLAPRAIVIEGRRQWNGKISEDLVANLSDEDIRALVEGWCRRRSPQIR